MPFLAQLAARGGAWHWIMAALVIIGALYAGLTALRGFLTAVVKVTGTPKDDAVVAAIFAFLDKFAYGFGKFEDYYDDWRDRTK